jgi:hypothetical protein
MARTLTVTDHAVLRHLERRLGFDVEAVRAEIEAICRRGADRGAETVLHGGLRYVLRHESGRTVVATALVKRLDYSHSLPAGGGDV